MQPPVDEYGGILYTWDDNGNLLVDGGGTYTYDQENRMVSVSGGRIY